MNQPAFVIVNQPPRREIDTDGLVPAMAARLRQQGRGKELVLAFGGDVNIGGLIDQSLPQSVPDGRARAAATRQRIVRQAAARRPRS